MCDYNRAQQGSAASALINGEASVREQGDYSRTRALRCAISARNSTLPLFHLEQ